MLTKKQMLDSLAVKVAYQLSKFIKACERSGLDVDEAYAIAERDLEEFPMKKNQYRPIGVGLVILVRMLDGRAADLNIPTSQVRHIILEELELVPQKYKRVGSWGEFSV